AGRYRRLRLLSHGICPTRGCGHHGKHENEHGRQPAPSPRDRHGRDRISGSSRPVYAPGSSSGSEELEPSSTPIRLAGLPGRYIEEPVASATCFPSALVISAAAIASVRP